MFNFFKSKIESNQPKTLGQLGEEFARKVYEIRGYKVIAANFFNKKGKRKGEVDFIARNKSQIVFVEVKTRGKDAGRFGTPADSVDFRKQAKLLQAVKVFLLQNPKMAGLKPRIDVCAVVVSDPSQLILVQANPPKYIYRGGLDPVRFLEKGEDGHLINRLDKSPFSVKILVNAVEDGG